MTLKKWSPFIIVICVIVLATLACEFSASTATIKNVTVASDEAGSQPTTVFAQDDIFYCIVELANAPDDTVVKSVWTAVNVEGEQPDLLIDEVEVTTGDSPITFDLSNTSLWPAGQYKVEIFLTGELDQTIDFQVQ